MKRCRCLRLQGKVIPQHWCIIFNPPLFPTTTTTTIPLPLYHYHYTTTTIPLPLYHYHYTTTTIPLPLYHYHYTTTTIPPPPPLLLLLRLLNACSLRQQQLKEAPYSFSIYQRCKLKSVLNKKTRCFCISICLLEYQRVIFKKNCNS